MSSGKKRTAPGFSFSRMLEEAGKDEKTPFEKKKTPSEVKTAPARGTAPLSIGVRIDKSIRDKSVEFENATYKHFGKKVGFSKQVRIALNIFYSIPFDFSEFDPEDDAEMLLMRQALSFIAKNRL